MSQENISEYLNPSRFPRMAFGLKANSTLHRITLTPSNANPGETLYIEIPKLTDNMVIVPGSVFLVFKLAISGHENNTVVNNISQNLVKRQRVVFGGETLQDTTNYDLFQTYHDLFLPKEERENMLRHGISSENMRKLRTGSANKNTSNAKEVAMATLHNTKYCIPLDHPILTDHGVFYPKSLPHPLKFEISLGPVADVVVFSDETKSPTYEITNPELEYRCISSKFLADQAQAAYKNNHAFFYENILHHKTFTFSKSYSKDKTYLGFAKGDKRFVVLSPDASNVEEINDLLGICEDFFSGKNTLIILDDCAVSKDLKNRTNKFINLAFSGRHAGLSVCVLTQQLTSIAKPFRDNVACVVAFHNPSQIGMKSLFEEFGGDLDSQTRKNLTKNLKSENYSALCFSLRNPYHCYLRIPSPKENFKVS